MQKAIAAVLAIIVVVGGGWYVYQNQNMGTLIGAGDAYAYTCDNGSTFTMTPSADMSFVTVTAGSQGMFTGSVELHKMGDGNHFENTSGSPLIVFSGAGEEVQLTVGSESTVCNPVPSSDSAPWNWGDAAEGGGSMQPDVRLVVGESIMGTWKSNQDATFTREFKDYVEGSQTGVVVDRHNNQQVSTGSYIVYTKEHPVEETNFPLEDNVVYVQLTMSGSQSDTMTFKLVKLTPEVLEMVYLDRGGVHTYTLVN